MLRSLYLSNLAVIHSTEAAFDPGFSAITGETGAGKSVLMNGLMLLLGGKADKEWIRSGEERGEISASFGDISECVLKKLMDSGIHPDEEGVIVFSRTIFPDGKSVSRINGRTVSMTQLREAVSLLVSIHGQNANHEMDRPGGERSLLDHATKIDEELRSYRSLYSTFCNLQKQKRDLEFDESEKMRMQEMLCYQIREISQVSPEIGEEEKLFEKKLALKNSGRIQKQTDFAYRALRGAEKGNAVYIVDRAVSALRNISDVVVHAGELADRLEESLSVLEEVADEVELLTEDKEEDPEAALDLIEERLSALEKLKRKYGGSIPEVLRFFENAKQQHERYETADAEIRRLQKEEDQIKNKLSVCAKKLYEKRVAAAADISARVTETLHFLDMPKASFRIDVSPTCRDGEQCFDENGSDRICFFLAANPGEPEIPVSRAASGGELARIMLAIRSHLSGGDSVDTVVYDEVDTGVSGKTARKIGLLMKEISQKTQIICVTHSAQIASLADYHFLVSKQETQGRTESGIRILDREERIIELSRILGGLHVTEAQRKAAEDLLNSAE